MNLFASTPSPIDSALALDDKRVVKMTIETAQMIAATVLHHFPEERSPKYKPTHLGHPITHWIKKDVANFNWLMQHHKALAQEYTHRTNGKLHNSWLDVGKKYEHLLTKAKPTDFINCARNQGRGIDFKWVLDVHHAYRMYLRSRWLTDIRQPVWTRREPPRFYDCGLVGSVTNDYHFLCHYVREEIGEQTPGKSGELDCPRCGDTINWMMTEDGMFFDCVTNRLKEHPANPCLFRKEL